MKNKILKFYEEKYPLSNSENQTRYLFLKYLLEDFFNQEEVNTFYVKCTEPSEEAINKFLSNINKT